jgi:acetoin utilization deacetylase AcuC-like enzyme
LISIFRHVPDVLDEFKPDIVVYNAGTDVLEGDPLGNLSISPMVIVILYIFCMAFFKLYNKKLSRFNTVDLKIYHKHCEFG